VTTPSAPLISQRAFLVVSYCVERSFCACHE
jgi:hypothetical protein